MALALVGNLGAVGSQLGLLQLGGPVGPMSFARPLPAKALSYIAHFYLNDGVTANTTTATASPLNQPPLKATTANGGFDAIELEFATAPAGVVDGNIVRLTEQGGDGSIVYSGIVEEQPDTISPTGTRHALALKPLGFELDDTKVQNNYTAPTDAGQIALDAFAATMHISADQVSCPINTGITGMGDFRNQTAKQQLDTARSIAGSNWFWFVDEQGRGWFQPMGSGAVYTIPRSQWEERTRNGGSITARKNDVLGIGGVPTGGSAQLAARYTGASQSGVNGIGIRSLDPPLDLKNITDQVTLNSIVATVGAVLDRVWNRLQIKVLSTYGKRIHGSQPGGAMVRYWEPAKDPLPESEAGGGYSGTYIVQEVVNDGLYQLVTAGDIPVTSQTDLDNMVQSLVQRASANSVQYVAAALNVPVSLAATGKVTSGAGANAIWSLTQQEFAAIDSLGVTRAEMGNLAANGISPAQWGFRANDATGTPLFDSLGVIGVMQVLGTGLNQTSLTFTSNVGTVVSGCSVSFTLSRSVKVLHIGISSGKITAGAGFVRGGNFVDGVARQSGGIWDSLNAGYSMCTTILLDVLGAGAHTIEYRIGVDVGVTWTNYESSIAVFQLGA